MKKLEEVIAEHMKDAEFRREWEALEPEFRRLREEMKSRGIKPARRKQEKRARKLIPKVAM